MSKASKKILTILLILTAISSISSCSYFINRNPVGKFLEDCSSQENIKNSILKVSPHEGPFEIYNHIDSLEWRILEKDTTYEVSYDFKKEIIDRNNVVGCVRRLMISKKNCQVIKYKCD